MENFAERVITFNKNLHLDIELPEGIRVMNPFIESPEAMEISSEFYRRFYSDNKERILILGINPGRFGAGITGIPFTDTKRLREKFGMAMSGISTHEPSSVFIYEVIEAFGGVNEFYSDFYINSPCPLGFTKTTATGKKINYNYYDSPELTRAVFPFMINSLNAHISTGITTSVAFCLGAGKNFKILKLINDNCSMFKELIPLEHPRYIMQYRSKQKQTYIEKYLKALRLG